MKEIWKPIPSFPGYEASNYGRIKSPWGNKLRPQIVGAGYHGVRVAGIMRKVHRLVFEAWFGAIPQGLEINHKNSDKTDNEPGNLEAVTHLQNMKHHYAWRDRVID